MLDEFCAHVKEMLEAGAVCLVKAHGLMQLC